MRYQETVLCSVGTSTSSQGSGAVSVHDFRTGSLLATFKQTCSDLHCTAVLQTKDGQGGFILSAQPDKPIINAYHFQKDQIAAKMVLPEKLSCIAIDNAGNYCAGGSAQGRIYLWEIASGILFNVWDAHYRKVTVLRFTQDGAALVSGSEDSAIAIWTVTSLVADDLQHETPKPYCMFTDHTLPITDIVCGIGSFQSCRILSSSIDHSVKLWDLGSRTLLTTWLFPTSVHVVAFENAERIFFAACSDSGLNGIVHHVRLFRRRDTQDGRPLIEAVGGGGVAEAIRLDADPKRVINVSHSVTALALSLTQSALLVGTTAGEVHLFDIASHQLLRSVTPVKDRTQGLSITHIECMLKPPDLVGHISLSLGLSGVATVNARDVIPTRPIGSFQRIRDNKARDVHEVPMMLPVLDEPLHDPTLYDTPAMLRDHSYFAQFLGDSAPVASGTNLDTPESQQMRVVELESEVVRLQALLARAKRVNDAMWETVVQKVIVPERFSPASGTGDIRMNKG